VGIRLSKTGQLAPAVIRHLPPPAGDALRQLAETVLKALEEPTSKRDPDPSALRGAPAPTLEPASADEVIAALQARYTPAVVAALVERITAGRMSAEDLSKLTDIPLSRLSHSSPAVVGGTPGLHMPGTPRESAGELPQGPAHE
jgi:hypothetical protein